MALKGLVASLQRRSNMQQLSMLPRGSMTLWDISRPLRDDHRVGDSHDLLGSSATLTSPHVAAWVLFLAVGL